MSASVHTMLSIRPAPKSGGGESASGVREADAPQGRERRRHEAGGGSDFESHLEKARGEGPGRGEGDAPTSVRSETPKNVRIPEFAVEVAQGAPPAPAFPDLEASEKVKSLVIAEQDVAEQGPREANAETEAFETVVVELAVVDGEMEAEKSADVRQPAAALPTPTVPSDSAAPRPDSVASASAKPSVPLAAALESVRVVVDEAPATEPKREVLAERPEAPRVSPVSVSATATTPSVAVASAPDAPMSTSAVTGLAEAVQHAPSGGPPGSPSHVHQAQQQTVFQTQAHAVIGQIAVSVGRTTEKSIEIRLDPPELGRVQIQLNPTERGVLAVVLADRPETGDMLRRNADELARGLAEAGYDDVSLEFAGHGDASHDTWDDEPAVVFAGMAETGGEETSAPALSGTPVLTDGLDIRL